MKAVLQRVSKAGVVCGKKTVADIGRGLLVLLGVAQDDTRADCELLVDKIKHLRIFPDENGKMNLSLKDIKGAILVVSQFTLFADIYSGRRPSLSDAAPASMAESLYEYVVAQFKKDEDISVATGAFGEHMDVSLVNDGPVTILFDTKGTAQ